MILRRIKAHVENENWFAVFIDFCIVVIGVFIGIQVANWNEARVDRDREALFLDRLLADFKQIERASLEAIYETDRSILLIESLIAQSDQASPDLSETLEPDEMYALTFHRSLVRGSSTYDELKSAGELRFIRSESLRSELADFERTRAVHASSGRSIEQNRERLAPKISLKLNLLYAANTTDDENVANRIVELTRGTLATEEFQKELGGLLAHYFTVKYWHEQTLEDVREVLADLDSMESAKQ